MDLLWRRNGSAAFAYKSSLRVVTILLFVLLLLASPTFAQTPDQRAGNFLFSVPSGWQRTEQNGTTVLLPADVPSNEANCFIMIVPGVELQSDFRLHRHHEPSRSRRRYFWRDIFV